MTAMARVQHYLSLVDYAVTSLQNGVMCQVKHAKFIDEGLHIISVCQLAGFQNLIETVGQTTVR